MSIYKDKSVGTGTQVDGYWQDVENKVLDPKTLSQEFPEGEFDSFSVKKTRRNFLKIMGFSVTALPLTGCVKIPVKKAVPYLLKNDTVIPGVANWYATTFGGYPVLAKTREGRPIKIEGNDKSIVTLGGTNSQMQASVLSLYDSYRYNSAYRNGEKIEWNLLDSSLKEALADVKSEGKEITVVAAPSTSPSQKAVLKAFTKKFNAKVVNYGSTSNDAILTANEKTFGVRFFPEFNLEEADVIVSFGADFLGTYGNDLSSSKQYVARRKPEHKRGLNKHVQIEALMSLTGSNADNRLTKTVKEQRAFLVELYNVVFGKTSTDAFATKLGKELLAKGKNSVVVSDDKSVDAQLLVNAINKKLGAYGTTIFAYEKEFTSYANNSEFAALVDRMNAGKVGAVLLLDVNPAYDYANKEAFATALKKVDVRVSFALAKDETSALCNFIAPTNHTFESWGDNQVSATEFAFTQPVIQPLFGTRQATETLMALAGVSGSYSDFVKSAWMKRGDGLNFWNKCLHDGVIVKDGFVKKLSARSVDASAAINKLKAMSYAAMTVETYEKTGIRNGAMANNPWLQELPDPITKATWDNYVMVSPKYAQEKGIKSGDVVVLKSKTTSVKIPAIVQPGTAYGTFGVALGYGRSVAGKVATNLGGNAFAFTSGDEVSLSKTGEFKGLAQTQTHHSMEGRDIVRETTYSEFLKDNKAGNHKKARLVNIYPEHKKTGHQWAMAIDLTQCTGCSSCIISCNAENNVPVVGRKEVAMRRDMHWLRIDRYYKGDENQPEVMHMPMLCQHCDNAPCENVCPVMAIVQSSDGLNQQVYNRCVGTRYCANNCPYKVRRFNWFNYDRGDSMAKMVLNPDVSQRSRGIMEKCSMCIQRIQEGKLEAKKARRPLKDGDIKLACQQSCPGDGIVFGDMNDPKSKVAKLIGGDRNYTVLEELNVRPRVSYLTKIRNK